MDIFGAGVLSGERSAFVCVSLGGGAGRVWEEGG